MRIGVFGGSFDPVHWGHLRLAECCWRQAHLDRVEFVPAARQPLKPRGPVASDGDRLAMLRRAIEGNPAFSISTAEIDRGGISYTADTLRAMKSALPRSELFFLMGADSLADFPNWREPDAICEAAMPLVVRRAGSPPPEFDSLRPFVSPEQLEEIRRSEVEMPATPISSSEIRRLIAAGDEWQSLTPAAVAEYIAAHRLYAEA
jgi:nicotinate-nucleotide adenylyltransferase